MKAGGQGPLAKALGLGRKPPEARARDDIVLSIMPAGCCVYVHWGKMAREVNKRHHLAAAAVLYTGPLHEFFACVSLVRSLVCGRTLNFQTQYPPTRTGLSRRPLAIVPASLAGFVVVGASASLWGSLLHASPSSTACLLPLLVLPFGTLGSGHPRSHHSVV